MNRFSGGRVKVRVTCAGGKGARRKPAEISNRTWSRTSGRHRTEKTHTHTSHGKSRVHLVDVIFLRPSGVVRNIFIFYFFLIDRLINRIVVRSSATRRLNSYTAAAAVGFKPIATLERSRNARVICR